MKWIVRSLNTTAGFLQNAPVEFAEGLTCVIGARGTCKSTIIETLRFLFDCDRDRVQFLTESIPPNFEGSGDAPSARGLVRASLQEGTARCVLSRANLDSTDFIIERSLDEEPKVYRDGIKEHEASGVLGAIEVYSQGELQRIAESSTRRLHLIDRPHHNQITEIIRKRSLAIQKLRALGPEIKKTKAEVAVLRDKVRALSSYTKDLELLRQSRPQLSDELEAEHKLFLERQALLAATRDALGIRDRMLHSLQSSTSQADLFSSLSQRLNGVDIDGAKEFSREFTELAFLLRSIQEQVQSRIDHPLGSSLTKLEQSCELLSQNYYSLRKDQALANESLRKEGALRQQIDYIQKDADALRTKERELQELTQERSTLRTMVAEASDTLYRLRLSQVEEINAQHGDTVLLSLRQGSQSEEYRAKIASLLQGSRLRDQEDVARDLADSVLPSDLVDIVEAGDSKRLSEVLSRDLGQMTRLVGFLIDHSKLYDVEGIIFDDHLDITMFVGGTPKALNQLSKGQMATALLPLILRDGSQPLLFDQPEDDLDNAFIFQSLVNSISSLKSRRQLIFVTHNANIPVLGDADRVVVMEMENPYKASPPTSGDLRETKDAIVSLLEGGAEAFRQRQERYGI